MSSNDAFIEQIAGYAQKYMRQTKVPASLTIAQAILESNYGKSGLSVHNKNLFGIKGKGESYPTKEFVNGQWITVMANFRSYETFEGSIKDHNEMLKRMKRYRAVIGEREWRKACQAVAAAGYATDPNYANKLIAIIQANELWKYDDWEDDDMDEQDAKKIIRILQEKYSQAKTDAQKNELHRLANAVRKASGQSTK